MLDYNKFTYLWPPRPHNAILPGLISFYENRKWTAQIKKNGSCTLWAVSPDKKFTIMNRHNNTYSTWTPDYNNYKAFLDLPNKWYVFTGELLHHKTPHIKDTFYIFDVLVSEGKYLVGSKFGDRCNMLSSMFKDRKEDNHYFSISEKLWLAKNHNIGFVNLYNQLDDIADEGLVLKNPEAILAPCIRQDDNTSWMVKIRKAHKNYGF